VFNEYKQGKSDENISFVFQINLNPGARKADGLQPPLSRWRFKSPRVKLKDYRYFNERKSLASGQDDVKQALQNC